MTTIIEEAHDLIRRLERQNKNTINMDCDAAADFLVKLFGEPSKDSVLKSGYYWFKCERATDRSIAQYISTKGWFTVNEVGPISIAELNRRGWYLDDPEPIS